MKYLILAMLLAACSDELISIPKRPVDGLCASPGALFSCPCGDGTWSGYQSCGLDYRVSACVCDAGPPSD